MSKNERGANQYTVDERPWTDEDTLYELYVERGLGAPTIADRLGCGKKTVYRWLDRHDIETCSQTVPEPLKSEEELHHLYWEKELSTNEIADALDCGNTTVHRWMEKHDISRRNVGGCADAPWRDEDTLRELYVNQRLSTQEVADEFGCTGSAIFRWLKKHDIPIRSQSEGQQLNTPELRDEELLRDLYVSQELSTRTIAERIGCSSHTVSRYLRKYDIETRESDWKIAAEGEENPSWKGGHQHGYGYNWEAQRAKARKRDGYQCRRCGMTQAEHIEETKLRLHVHHIERKESFVNEDGEFDPDEANCLDNLITLCASCHYRLEGLPIDVR